MRDTIIVGEGEANTVRRLPGYARSSLLIGKVNVVAGNLLANDKLTDKLLVVYGSLNQGR